MHVTLNFRVPARLPCIKSSSVTVYQDGQVKASVVAANTACETCIEADMLITHKLIWCINAHILHNAEDLLCL